LRPEKGEKGKARMPQKTPLGYDGIAENPKRRPEPRTRATSVESYSVKGAQEVGWGGNANGNRGGPYLCKQKSKSRLVWGKKSWDEETNKGGGVMRDLEQTKKKRREKREG